jgi:hypothetical protein
MAIDRWNREALEQSDAGCAYDFHDDDKTALVVFAGLAVGDQSIADHPHFEFFNVAAGLPVSKLFIRDLDQVWYQRGVRGLGSTVPEVRDALAAQLDRFEHVVFLGGSSGGYAALLLGALLGVDRVLAFSPQTFVGRGRRMLHRDRRWPKEIAEMRRSPALSSAYLDLKPVLRDAPASRFDIYFGSGNRLDRLHARRVRAIPGVSIHAQKTDSHGVQRQMRDAGLLDGVLREAMGLGPKEPDGPQEPEEPGPGGSSERATPQTDT